MSEIIRHILEYGPFRVEVGERKPSTSSRDPHIKVLCEERTLGIRSSSALLIMALAAGDGKVGTKAFQDILRRSTTETPEHIFFGEPNLEARGQARVPKFEPGAESFLRYHLPNRMRIALRDAYKDELFHGYDPRDLVSFPKFDAHFFEKNVRVSSVHLDAWKRAAAPAPAASDVKNLAAEKRRAAISAAIRPKGAAPRM